MGEIVVGQENYAYIPLSSFIILLAILLTCAFRKRKVESFAAVEQNLEDDIKGEYAIMCFPCLKKKPDLSEFEPTTDLSDQFEYIVEKYTIRKVPLLLANTAEDIIERQEELELARIPCSQSQLIKDDFLNFQVSQEVYNVQKVPPCITVAANTACPGRRSIKEKLKPSDVLESMSPIPRPTVRNPNYVVIPTRGSIRSKDIMMTKREITNQYLNNFSSVFVDNLKDQIPKDPEQFPSLSRPYTSALRNYPISEQVVKSTGHKKSKKGKTQKISYAFPIENPNINENNLQKESVFYDSDSMQEQASDVPESECQEEGANDFADFTEKSKSFSLLNDSDSAKEEVDCTPNSFKTEIKSSTSEMEQNPAFSNETDFHTPSFTSQKDEWPNVKNVTYEDIQALDVGYEFTSSEKLGVKPKMTRIHYPHESERLSIKHLSLGETKPTKKCFPNQEQASGTSMVKSVRGVALSKLTTQRPESGILSNIYLPPTEKNSSKSVITETSFLPIMENPASEAEEQTLKSCPDQMSTTTFTSKSHSVNDFEPNSATAMEDTVAEISKLYELSSPAIQRWTDSSSLSPGKKESKEPKMCYKTPSKSFSCHEPGRSVTKKENVAEVKGKGYLPYPSPKSTKKIINRLDEPETETSCSLYSHESKTSSMLTSPRSSEQDESKRATLRWKIVIKHHREDESSKKNVNTNKKH